MDTASIWSILADTSIGTLFAWGAVIIAIITAIIKGIKRLYVFFDKYKKLKDENDHQSKLLKEHDQTLKEIKESLNNINKRLDEQKEFNFKQIRNSIVDSCYAALSAGEIQIGKHKALEEMFEEYTKVFNGNGYVKGLIKKVNELPIVGTLDE